MLSKSGLLLSVVVLLAACSPSGEPPAPLAAKNDVVAVAAGEKLFRQYCSDCHPRTGRGDYLKKIPSNMLLRRSKSELMAWIRGSDKHREMPNFRQLTDTEREQLAIYLHAQVYK